MLGKKFWLVAILAPLSVAQRATAPRHPAHANTVEAAPPIPEWPLPLFTSEPREVLAAAAQYGTPEDFDAVVLEQFIHVEIDSSGRMKQTTRMVTHVLRLQGIASARQVVIGWIASHENRPKIKARVITSDGKAHMLEEGSITDTPVPASAGVPPDAHVLSAILPGVDYDSIVEIEAEQSDREPVYPGGRWGEVWLDTRNPIFRFSADMVWESPFPLRFQARGFAEGSTQETSVKGHLTFNASRIVKLPNEMLAPPDAVSSPVIRFSTVRSWQEIAQWCAQNFQTNPKTMANLLGSSVDKAILLMSKFKGKLALIRAAPGLELSPDQPGIEGFNRVLVYVPGEPGRWVDPSAEDAGLPIADQGRWALIADEATTGLIRTPESTAQDNRRMDKTEIQLQDGGPAKVKTTTEAHGAFEEALRDKNVREATSEDYAASRVADAGGFIDLPGPAAVKFQRLGSLIESLGEGEAARKDDYYVFPPFSEESRYHVRLPAGFRFGELPKMENIALGPLTLSASEKIEGDGSLSVTYGLTSPKSRYTPQEGAAMRKDAAQKLAGKAVLRVLFINTAEEMIAKGNAKEGLELLRQNAGASTNAALRLADGYLGAGSRAEAVKVCQQAIAKDPKNASAYARLGWVYAHDEAGRLYAEGMDQAEAEKAFKQAIELNPEERSYLIQLATLETYNQCGIRYGKGARVADAIEGYSQAGMHALEAMHSVNDFAGSLLFAGRYEEVRQFYLNPEAELADPAIKIAAIAAGTSANDAKEEAAFLPMTDKMKGEVLAHAARYLLIARQYAIASKLGVADERLRRVKKFDGSAVSGEPAVAALERFIDALLNPAAPEEWKKFLAPGAASTPVDDYRSRLFKLFTPAGKAPESIQWPYIADVLTSTLDFKVEGSGATYSILAGQKVIAHVVKRGDEFLVLDLVS